MGGGRLLFAGVVVGLTIIAFVLAALPIGAPTKAEGVITSLDIRKNDMGAAHANAVVRLGEVAVQVRLPAMTRCRPGDGIVVVSQKTLVGQRHRAGREGCAVAGT